MIFTNAALYIILFFFAHSFYYHIMEKKSFPKSFPQTFVPPKWNFVPSKVSFPPNLKFFQWNFHFLQSKVPQNLTFPQFHFSSHWIKTLISFNFTFQHQRSYLSFRLSSAFFPRVLLSCVPALNPQVRSSSPSSSVYQLFKNFKICILFS